MTITIALLLTTLPLLILSCHPGKPASWKTRGVRTRVLTPRVPYTAEEEEDGSLSGVDAPKHTTPTSVRLWETTSSQTDLPACQQCGQEPRSDAESCLEKKCSTIISKVAIIQGCSVSELSCAEPSQVVDIETFDGKRTKHSVDEIRSARCWDGEWQVETLNGTLSIDNIVCFI